MIVQECNTRRAAGLAIDSTDAVPHDVVYASIVGSRRRRVMLGRVLP